MHHNVGWRPERQVHGPRSPRLRTPIGPAIMPALDLERMISHAAADEHLRGDLLEHYRGYLLLLARRGIGSEMKPRVDAEDIVQTTMLRASRGFASFSGQSREQFFQWLMTIHRNTIAEELSWQHAAKRDPGKERSWQRDDTSAVLFWLEPADDQPTPSVRMMRDEQALKLAKALSMLTTDQSEAVRLRHLEGWSVERIAEHMEKSPQAAAGLIKRGLSALRTRMACAGTR